MRRALLPVCGPIQQDAWPSHPMGVHCGGSERTPSLPFDPAAATIGSASAEGVPVRKALSLVAFALVCAGGSTAPVSMSAQQAAPPTFKTGVRLVEVDVVVRDGDDRFVDALTKDDFEVLEDGAPRQIQQLWTVN